MDARICRLVWFLALLGPSGFAQKGQDPQAENPRLIASVRTTEFLEAAKKNRQFGLDAMLKLEQPR